jgi:putative inorganic carbon (HCO3(-)) transporter
MAIRDLALTLLLLGGLPFALARPFVGALFFAWLSLMNPHRLTWGFASSFQWAQFYAIATLLGFVFMQDRKLLADSFRRVGPLAAYLVWMTVTTVFAIETSAALSRLNEVVKILLMCFITLCLLTTPRRITLLAVVACLSIAFYGVKGGYFTAMGSGVNRVWGPAGTVIEDNNQLGTALVMTIPILYWLALTAKRRAVQLALYGVMLLSGAAVLGTHSRGAFLAALFMGGYLLLKSTRRGPIFLVICLAAAFALTVMPAEYWQRIETITSDEKDGSVQGRLNVWKVAFDIANQRLVGAGFDYYEGTRAFLLYAPDLDVIRSSHSIYFQSLGEHGWIGLTLFLLWWIYVWRCCARAYRRVATHPSAATLQPLVRMIQASMVGYAVGGATVNIGYWDFPFYLAIIALAIERMAPAPQPHPAAFRNVFSPQGRPPLGVPSSAPPASRLAMRAPGSQVDSGLTRPDPG